MFNATFNNISVTWKKPSTYHWQTLSHNVKLSTPCHEIQLPSPYDHALPPLWECVKPSTPCHGIQLPYDHALSPLWEWKVFVSNLLTAYSPVLYLKIKKNRSKSHVKIKSRGKYRKYSGPQVTFPQGVRSLYKPIVVEQNLALKNQHSQTCIKRSPLGQRKSGLIWQVTS